MVGAAEGTRQARCGEGKREDLPSKAPTWALGSTSAQVLRLILESVCRISGQARRRTSTSPAAPGVAGDREGAAAAAAAGSVAGAGT